MFGFLKNITKFFELFKEGKEIANAATWKSRTIATNAILALLGTVLVLAKSYGFNVLLLLLLSTQSCTQLRQQGLACHPTAAVVPPKTQQPTLANLQQAEFDLGFSCTLTED